MIGRLRVPSCYVIRCPYENIIKFNIYSKEKIKKNWSLIPLLMLKVFVIVSIPVVCYHRFFVTMIDFRTIGTPRHEITSPPGFFDLRNPRILKMVKRHELKPAIYLDNLYRLMRKEPMLDADGNETDEIGKDETAPPSLEEADAIMKKKGHDYFLPTLEIKRER